MNLKFAGRKIKLSKLPLQLLVLVKILYRAGIFTDSYSVLKSYFTKRNIPPYLKLRNGLRIYLSSHPEDIVTAIVVFCKHDYGTDFAGKTIIDIGANIGTFSLFAALKGAKKIVAIEPGQEAIDRFKMSIEANGLQDLIVPISAAVTSRDGQSLHFPILSSPNNTPTENASGTASVRTITLETIVRQHFESPIDLLKIDCEGGEYDILYHASDETLARIRQIRMELHGVTHKKEALLSHLQEKGFNLNKYRHDNAWLTNTNV